MSATEAATRTLAYERPAVKSRASLPAQTHSAEIPPATPVQPMRGHPRIDVCPMALPAEKVRLFPLVQRRCTATAPGRALRKDKPPLPETWQEERNPQPPLPRSSVPDDRCVCQPTFPQ